MRLRLIFVGDAAEFYIRKQGTVRDSTVGDCLKHSKDMIFLPLCITGSNSCIQLTHDIKIIPQL